MILMHTSCDTSSSSATYVVYYSAFLLLFFHYKVIIHNTIAETPAARIAIGGFPSARVTTYRIV